MRLLIVIVNYRTPDLTVDCLRSLEPEVTTLGEGTCRVVVTDNLSGDGSADALARAVRENGWEGWCEVRPLDRNGGFAYGNNRALPPVPDLPSYVMLLNPDTVVRAGAMKTLLDFADAHPRAGIVGSRLEDPDATPQTSAFNAPSLASEVESRASFGPVSALLRPWCLAPPAKNRAHRCAWVAGACMLVRREVFEQIGLMDEGYFMYFEEVDFCVRAARAGWECWYVPEAHVVHLVGQASGVTDVKRPAKRRPAYWFESRQRYFQKNHGLAYAVLADMAWVAGHAIRRANFALRGRPNNDPPLVLRDFVWHALHRKHVR